MRTDTTYQNWNYYLYKKYEQLEKAFESGKALDSLTLKYFNLGLAKIRKKHPELYQDYINQYEIMIRLNVNKYKCKECNCKDGRRALWE